MLKYIIRRILLLIPVMIGVVAVVFTINYFNHSSPAITILGAQATPEKIAEIEATLGLDRSYWVQLGEYLWNAFTKLDFGTSYIYNIPVTTLIVQRFPTTAIMGVVGVLLSVIIGIPLGVLAATRQYTIYDYGSTILSTVLSALPNFWVALMLILMFAVKLKWVPVSGLPDWRGWILPVISVAIGPIAIILRMTRSSMLEVIRQDYIRTARAKGLAERKIITHHVLKNGLIPVVTVVGMMIATSMTGTIIVETIFNINGLGLLIYSAIISKDFVVVQGSVIVCALIISVMNLITDVAYAYIDPRIKAQYVQKKKRRIRGKEGTRA